MKIDIVPPRLFYWYSKFYNDISKKQRARILFKRNWTQINISISEQKFKMKKLYQFGTIQCKNFKQKYRTETLIFSKFKNIFPGIAFELRNTVKNSYKCFKCMFLKNQCIDMILKNKSYFRTFRVKTREGPRKRPISFFLDEILKSNKKGLFSE